MLVNNRHISLSDLMEQRVAPHCGFEAALFSCIREWHSNAQEFIFQTSGSTGTPTAIKFTRDQLIRSAQSTAAAFGLTSDDTALVCLTPTFVAGRMMIVRAMVSGMEIVAVNPTSNPLADIPEDRHIDFAAFVPLQLQTMLESDLHERLRRIRTILVGGAPVSRYLRQLALDRLANNVYQTYGMTETLTHAALDHITSPEEAFHAMPGVVLSKDERGCLTIYSPVVDRRIVTNDLVEFLQENSFRWLGRYDNVVNSGGIKLIPEQIEKKVETIFIRLNIQHRFILAGLPDERLGSELVLLVEAEPAEGLAEKLTGELSAVLDKYENPRRIHFLPAFASTESGKINRVETVKRLNCMGMEKR